MGNYYIGAMSILNGKLIKDGVISQWQELSADNGVVYRGFQTNEAPAKYLMDYLSDKGMHFDRIILFVTDECKNDYYMINGERINTIDYFRRALIEHIEQRIKNKEHSYDQTMSTYWPDISGYVDSVLMFEPLSYRPGNKELHDKLNNLIEDVNDCYIFFDFTGGSRISQMISLLFIRVMGHLGAKVEKVVYADIVKSKEIVDCTRNYEVCLLIELKNESTQVKYAQACQALGIEEHVDLKKEEKFDNIEAGVRDSVKTIGNKEKTQIRNKLDATNTKNKGILQQRKMSRVQNIEKYLNENNPFKKFGGKKDEELIKDFYEQFFDALIDVGVIKFRDERHNKNIRSLKKAFMQMYSYYSDSKTSFDGKTVFFHSFVDECSSILDELIQKPGESPVEILDEHFDFLSEYYIDFLSIQKHPAGVNLCVSEKFLRSYTKRVAEKNYEDKYLMLEEMKKAETVYFNYGFPFMCYDQNQREHADVSRYYIDKSINLFKKIDIYRQNHTEEEYFSYVNEVKRDLKKRIPFKMDSNYCMVNPDFFSSDDEKKEFFAIACERLERIRPMRNDIAHKMMWFKPADKKKTAEEIRGWLKEYADWYDRHVGK